MNYNHDGLATDLIGDMHPVIAVHGSIDPWIGAPEALDLIHTATIEYPTASEVQAALDSLLSSRLRRDIQNLDQLAASLAGGPMSDVAWVVNEAARLAARGKKDAIDDIDLFSALKRRKR